MEPSRIDWDAIEIEPRWDEEGTEGVASEHGLYVKLGLQKEDEKGKKVRESRAKKRGVSTFENEYIDDHEGMAYLEHIPEDRAIVYDWTNPVMKVGALYPNMSVFRLAVRHYAIMKEFELGIETTSTSRYRGLCMGDDCPWRLHAVLEVPGSATIIVFNFFLYYLYLPFILFFSTLSYLIYLIWLFFPGDSDDRSAYLYFKCQEKDHHSH